MGAGVGVGALGLLLCMMAAGLWTAAGGTQLTLGSEPAKTGIVRGRLVRWGQSPQGFAPLLCLVRTSMTPVL